MIPSVYKINFSEPEWDSFVDHFSLSSVQQDQFKMYLHLLLKWNDFFNITAIVDPLAVIQSHFYDSLVLGDYCNMSLVNGLADVGSGGGFPGIPLKIKYPHIKVVLIEVSNKKQAFLTEVINTLGLQNIEIYGYDWRTFLRKTDYAIDLICARASLRPDELLRMFKPSSFYGNAKLVYWASDSWKIALEEQPFFDHENLYTVSSKARKLIFFKQIV